MQKIFRACSVWPGISPTANWSLQSSAPRWSRVAAHQGRGQAAVRLQVCSGCTKADVVAALSARGLWGKGSPTGTYTPEPTQSAPAEKEDDWTVITPVPENARALRDQPQAVGVSRC